MLKLSSLCWTSIISLLKHWSSHLPIEVSSDASETVTCLPRKVVVSQLKQSSPHKSGCFPLLSIWAHVCGVKRGVCLWYEATEVFFCGMKLQRCVSVVWSYRGVCLRCESAEVCVCSVKPQRCMCVCVVKLQCVCLCCETTDVCVYDMMKLYRCVSVVWWRSRGVCLWFKVTEVCICGVKLQRCVLVV